VDNQQIITGYKDVGKNFECFQHLTRVGEKSWLRKGRKDIICPVDACEPGILMTRYKYDIEGIGKRELDHVLLAVLPGVSYV